MTMQEVSAAERLISVEEFINSITVQLDRVQDALRLKSLNRPLTYALKDFSLDLQVFVALDPTGHVRFRNSGPNEAGASTVRLGFTTITKPMIEENTISLAATRSPSLDQIGLDPGQRNKLEQLGVHNAAQLRAIFVDRSADSVAATDHRSTGCSKPPPGKPPVSTVTPVTTTPVPTYASSEFGDPVAPGTPPASSTRYGAVGRREQPVRLNREALSPTPMTTGSWWIYPTRCSGALSDAARWRHRRIPPEVEPQDNSSRLDVQADRWAPSRRGHSRWTGAGRSLTFTLQLGESFLVSA
jgi:hypothetical protein